MKLLINTLALVSVISMGMKSPSNVPGLEDDKTVQAFYRALQGEWGGTYSLWFKPNEPVRNSDATAEGRFLAREAFFLLTYTWHTDDMDQEGVFLLGGKGETASATWGDTWHMQPDPMVITEGELTSEGQELVFLGSYGTGPDSPDWGWRTEFTLQGEDAFLMEAYNITPDGLEALAVRAELTRL
jgi:hypothetical protein